jgi:nucleotide-binding universal stress UspA family protein
VTGTQAFAIAFLAVWGASAIGLGIVMQRRGYSGWGWGVIAGVLGPIGILLALLARNPMPPDRWSQSGLAAKGPVDALIGTDGSPDSIAAATQAIDLLGDRLGRVTLATVAPFDANHDYESRAEDALATARDALAGRLAELAVVPGAVVLHGRPAEALIDRARDDGYDVIVVGSHGHGASAALLGRVSAALVEHAAVPLLVTGRNVVPRRPRPTETGPSEDPSGTFGPPPAAVPQRTL